MTNSLDSSSLKQNEPRSKYMEVNSGKSIHYTILRTLTLKHGSVTTLEGTMSKPK